MAELFKFKTQEVQTYQVNNQVWFKGKQVAEILEYKNPREAIRTHVDPEDRMTLAELKGGRDSLPPLETNEQGQQWVINESGLYCLVLKSRQKEAVEFRKWVTKEVLPNIRKTGQYKIEQLEKTVDWLQDHQGCPDAFYQKLPQKKMPLTAAERKKRIIEDMRPFLNNPWDFNFVE